MVFRILIFSILAALLLYIPFYYFAPIYHQCYVHVPDAQINVWSRNIFGQDHGGIQLYIAYVLMYLAIAFAFLLEFIYTKLNLIKSRKTGLIVGAVVICIYAWIIGFHPPMARVCMNGEEALFVLGAVIIAFIFGHFYERKVINWLLILLLLAVCMVPTMLTFLGLDYYYLFTPAMRTLRGFALNQSYFQYDHILSFLCMAWMKLGLPIDRFYNLIDFTYVVFFFLLFLMAKKIFFNKQLAVYFILSLVILKIYGNQNNISFCPQVCPIRLDEWLALLILAYWKGPQHWSLGVTFCILLMFHHAFGMIYSISYVLLILTILLINLSQDSRKIIPNLIKISKAYILNVCLILGGFLINQIFISSDKTIPAMNYMKYNVGFLPISMKSLFWYVPVMISCAFLLIWKSRKQLSERYFLAFTFLIFLAIGNLLYFFGRSHENNLINLSGSLWLIFFMLVDLIIYQRPQEWANRYEVKFIAIIGVCIVGISAYFYADTAIGRVDEQLKNLPKIADLVKPDKGVDFDYSTLKAVTWDNPNIIFLSPKNDFKYYYYGNYTPSELCPMDGQFFVKDLLYSLHHKLEQGADIIVAEDEFKDVVEMVLMTQPKYISKYKGFIYLSDIPPAF